MGSFCAGPLIVSFAQLAVHHISYNPQSLRRCDRERRVVHALQSKDVTALTGTRLPANDLEVSARSCESFDVYSWGFGQGQYTNTHTGVQLCLKRRIFRQCHAVQVSCPTPALQGRGGALRVKRPDSNLPYPQRVNDALWNWVDKAFGRAAWQANA